MSLEDLKNSLGEDVLTSMYEYLIREGRICSGLREERREDL